MKILFASSEIVPFASTGGLGDVLSSLPKALASQGVDVVRMMPLYNEIDREKWGISPCDESFVVSLGSDHCEGSVWVQHKAGVTTYFIYSDRFFNRAGIYGENGEGYEDNFERFLFFQKAVVRLIDQWNLAPDIVHCNDWQTGLIPMLLEHGIGEGYRGGPEKTLFTIHNLAHQGWSPAEKFYKTALPAHCYTMHTLEFYGEINTMKGGIVGATAINAVSPTYAKEIQTEAFGCQLDGLIRERSSVLHGILNGIDYSSWSPELDPYIEAPYSVEDLSGKKACKHALQIAAGLDPDPDRPLLGVVSRLVPQKGIDLIIESIEQMLDLGVQLVLLGTGDDYYEDVLRDWSNRWPGQVCTWIEFSQEKAHQIEAGSDLFLMPSQFEPCGQNQLYSMRYGTLPVVHGVGGLEDSVMDASAADGTGFKFYGYQSVEFLSCLKRALAVYQDKEQWQHLMITAMKKDFSVVHMAEEYIELYADIMD